MTRCHIDHLTITAPTLDAGAEYVRQAIGVVPQRGGEHPRMGTHNLLLRLGDALFLEVIAINPCAPSPGRPRWFALDTLAADASPQLATWVARTPDIHASVANSSEALGEIEPMHRGALQWHITIPRDGALALNGVAPALIQWQASAHPATTLQDHGLSLAKLEFFHPEPQRIARLLQSLHFEGPISVSHTPGATAASMVAHISTPHGMRSL